MANGARPGVLGGLVMATVLGVLLAGCGSPGDPGSGPAPTGPVTPLPDADPPLAFGERIWLGDGYQVAAFHVDGAVLYTYGERASEITTWELATGTRLASVPVDLDGGLPREPRQGSPYAFTEINGAVALVVAYEHLEQGAGTQPNQYLLRVRAYDAGDGSLMWSEDVNEGDIDEIALTDIRILASDVDHTVVVAGALDPAVARIGRDEASLAGTSVVLETATGQVRQVWDPFVAYALDGDVVAGLLPDLDQIGQQAHTVLGRHVFTGEAVWEEAEEPASGADYFGRDAGGGVFVQPARARGTSAVVSATRSTNLVRQVATGDILFEIDHDGAAVGCRHDGDQLLVCSHDPADQDEPFLAVYDLHSRSMLWDMADIGDDRDLPSTVSAAYQGVVYMDFTSASRRPVALDARTGDDLAVDLPVAPHRVGPGYGLVYEEFGYLSIYPANG